MKWTLSRKFVTVSALFMAASFLLTVVVGTFTVRRYLLSSKVSSMTAAGSSISSFLSSGSFSAADRQSLTQDMLCLVGSMDEYTIWVLNTEGTVLFSTDESAGIQVPFNPVLKGTYFRGTYSDYLKQDTISVYSPIISQNSYQPAGYVLVHYPYSQILRARNRILSRFYFIWGFCALLWIIFSFTLYRIVSRPIQGMLNTAQQFANDSAEIDFAIHTSDEIGALSDILNRMFARLRAVHEDQQQFIANVSHDLRSPLTSIKGYLEAIQDGTIPPELEGKYINIVLHETNRLADLTRNLLTLSSLDSKKSPLERTRFDINSVIRQVLPTFEQRCQQKEICFNLTFSDKSQMVYADLIRIQQVLYNLIDNAIKFSFPGSVIDISTFQRYGKLFVSVRDYGCGIPQESLDKIWNRFYKTDPSRGLDKKGTGLGLTIVRDIISLHGESVQVSSKEGEGSEFVFSLPSA